MTTTADLLERRPPRGLPEPALPEQVAPVARLDRPAGGATSTAGVRVPAVATHVPDGALAHLLWASVSVNAGNRIAIAAPADCAP